MISFEVLEQAKGWKNVRKVVDSVCIQVSPAFPLPFPVRGTVLFPPVTPSADGEAGWQAPARHLPPALGKLRGGLCVLLCARGGGSTRV